MLFDRMCPGVVECKNGIAFVKCAAYIEPAIALLALAGHENEPWQTSLTWLMNRLPGCPSPYSLAGVSSRWRHIETSAAKRRNNRRRHGASFDRDDSGPAQHRGVLVAFEAAEGDNVFEVRS
jgi:hypothetical protein